MDNFAPRVSQIGLVVDDGNSYRREQLVDDNRTAMLGPAQARDIVIDKVIHNCQCSLQLSHAREIR